MASFAPPSPTEALMSSQLPLERFYAQDGTEYPCMFLPDGPKLQAVGPLPQGSLPDESRPLSGGVAYFGAGDDTNPLLRLSEFVGCTEFVFVDSMPLSYYGERLGEPLDKLLRRVGAILSSHERGNEITTEMIEEGKHYLFRIGEAKQLHYFVNTTCEALEETPTLVALLSNNIKILWMQGYSPPASVFSHLPLLEAVVATPEALCDDDGNPLYDDLLGALMVVLVLETEFDDVVGRYFYHQDIESNFIDDEGEEEEEEEEERER